MVLDQSMKVAVPGANLHIAWRSGTDALTESDLPFWVDDALNVNVTTVLAALQCEARRLREDTFFLAS